MGRMRKLGYRAGLSHPEKDLGGGYRTWNRLEANRSKTGLIFDGVIMW
jgi:hypothetical protein